MSVTSTTRGEPGWKRDMARAVRDPAALLRALDLPDALLPAAEAASHGFPLLVPPHYLSRIRPGDPADPLLRQVLPLGEELRMHPRATRDPLEEEGARPAPGLVRKYARRALLVTTGVCAVHCRYCFRRHFPYAEAPRRAGEQLEAFRRQLAADPELDEAILSGGDPLMLPEASLEELLRGLDAEPRVRRLRVHTRLPIVLPSRVDARLLALLRGLGSSLYVVAHANHPRELSPEVGRALRALRGAGAVVLNQAVLLRGVNDDAAVLADLCLRLADLGVLPYYLHQLDPVEGAMHFEVPDPEARELHRELRGRVPGYALPELVRELPGEASKLPV